MNYENFFPKLFSICELASKEILEVYESEDFQTERKGDKSPVTIADKRSDKVLNEELSKLTPNIPVMSEESLMLPYEEREKWESFWCVDPLDGTREFLTKNDQFAICVALVTNRRPVVGIIHEVVSGKSYYAWQGGGAFVRDKSGKVEKISCKSFKWGEENLNILCSRSHLNKETEDFISAFPNHNKMSMGAALKFCMIASGQAHMYARLGPTSEWDSAAGDILLLEAGGEVLRYEDKKRLDYNKKKILNPYFVAMGSLER